MTLAGQPSATSLTTPKSELAPVLAALKQGLGEGLVAIVLYGSRARGDHHPQSDWDLLVIAEGLPKKPFRRHLDLKRMLPDRWRGRVSLLAKTPAEFEAHLPSLFLDIALDGHILYDTDGYISIRLAHINQRMQEQGLYREQQGQDLIWRWRTQPTHPWQLSWEDVL